jgi:hypothetical protein
MRPTSEVMATTMALPLWLSPSERLVADCGQLKESSDTYFSGEVIQS